MYFIVKKTAVLKKWIQIIYENTKRFFNVYWMKCSFVSDLLILVGSHKTVDVVGFGPDTSFLQVDTGEQEAVYQ